VKCYYDLYTRPADRDALIELLESAKRLGYCLLGVEYEGDWKEAKSLSQEIGIRIVRVVVLEGDSRSEVARSLPGKPRNALFFVKATNQDVARYASANKKFAGFLAVPGQERLIDRSTKTLFHERGWGIVLVTLNRLLSERKSRRTWRYYYLALRRAYAYKIDLALVSAARTGSELWHPLSAIGVGELFGVPAEYTASWLTSHPARIVSILTR